MNPDRQLPKTDDQSVARLLDALADAVVSVDGQGRLVWANPAAERLFGRSLADWVGLSVLEFIHPDDLQLVLRSLVSIQGKDVGEPIELRLATASGWRLLELVGTPVPWLAEDAVLLSMRDLTDRRRFELARNEEARFRSLVQNASSVTILVSPTGLVESVSGSLTRSLGHDPELVEQRPLSELVSSQDRPALAEALERASRDAPASNPVSVAVHLLRHASQENVPFELTIVNLIDDPTVGGFVVSAHDITAQATAELELREALSLLKATLDSTADGILVVDNAGRIATFNHRFAELWGLPESILATRNDAAAIAFVMDQLARPDEFVAKVAELYVRPEAESFDTLQFTDGRVFERYSRPQRVGGEVVGRVWSFRDVTDRQRFETELAHQAFHDSLTGLANKAQFQDRLERAASRIERTQSPLAVLFLDLDDFKTVNDTLGHSAGDELLRGVAEVLLGCLRASDTVARLGGDEFAILVEDLARPNDAIDLAERILASCRRPLIVDSVELSATVSIGIAVGLPGDVSDHLLRNADLAMYAAKARGKNRYAEFEDEMRVTVVRHRFDPTG